MSKEKQFLRKDLIYAFLDRSYKVHGFFKRKKPSNYLHIYKTFQVKFCTAVKKMLQQCGKLQPDLIR